MAKTIKRIVPFEEVITALLDNEHPFPPVFLHRFSDIPEADLAKVKSVWNQVAAERKTTLFEDLEMLADSDTLLSMETIARFGLNDSEAHVREISARLLWETGDTRLIPQFIDMMKNDPAEVVRASATTSLGLFIYLGELEEINAEAAKAVETALFEVYESSDTELVRRRTLEALSFSSHEKVQKMIRQAYNSNDREWVASAVFAMGRSSNEKWIPSVLEMLDHDDDRIQFEAVRAAGELSAKKAREPLLTMLENGVDDDELRMAVVWSLSQIGGEDVRETLENMLEECEDDEEAGVIEEAIDNLFLTEGMDNLDMFDFGVEDEDHLDNVVNLEQEDDQDDDPDSER